MRLSKTGCELLGGTLEAMIDCGGQWMFTSAERCEGEINIPSICALFLAKVKPVPIRTKTQPLVQTKLTTEAIAATLTQSQLFKGRHSVSDRDADAMRHSFVFV